MKTFGKVVTTHLNVMTDAEIKECLIKDEERIQQDIDTNDNIPENTEGNEKSIKEQTIITFEDYRNNNISRSLNNDNNDKCCNCDWKFCLAETW